MENPKKIVVGFDGSDGSVKALEWALHQSDLTGAPLSIVRAPEEAMYQTHEEKVRIAQKTLEEDVISVIGKSPVPWQAIAEFGHPAEVLLSHVSYDDMLVVGTRGHGGFVGLLIGSVSQQVAAHANAAAVVVVK